METLMSILGVLKAMAIVSFKFSIFIAMIVGFIEYCKEEKINGR